MRYPVHFGSRWYVSEKTLRNMKWDILLLGSFANESYRCNDVETVAEATRKSMLSCRTVNCSSLTNRLFS